MIPVSLTLQGIYSYQEKQTIDFAKLTNAGIFGIFGPVGSGKSTILEAITFALYGRTDRLNLSGDNRNYNMMNLKSNEMLIEFVFRTGPEPTEYMALVRSRRNSRQFEDVKACERTAYQKTGDEWIPVDVETLEKATGLSYDNFKRTVIIPQGRFQEFLYLKGAERSEMLKELFNLQRFELSSKVISLETKAFQQKQNIEGNLQQLGDVSAKKIALTEEALSQTISFLESKTAELVKIQQEEIRMRHIKELVQKRDGYRLQLSDLKNQEQEIAILEQRLKAYEYCLLTFKELINTCNQTRSGIEHLRGEIAGEESRLQEISLVLKKVEDEFGTTLRKEYDSRETLRQKAEELSKIVRIIDLQERQSQFRERIAKGEKTIGETLQKIEALKNKADQLTLALTALKDQFPDMNRLSKAREWFTIRNMLGSEGEKIARDKTAVTLHLDELVRQKERIAVNEVFPGPISGEEQDIAGWLESRRREHAEALEMLSRERQYYQVQQKLEEYASELHDGKPCPLCGSMTHPQKFNAIHIREALLKIESEIKTHEQASERLVSSLKKLSELNTAIALKEEIRNGILLNEEENQSLAKAHQEHFCWEELQTEADLEKAFEEAERIRVQIQLIEKELETARAASEKENNQKELYCNALESIKSHSLKEQATADTLVEQLVLLDLKAYCHRNPDDLNAEKEILLQHHATIEQKYQKALDEMNLLRKDQDILSGKLETNRKMLAKEQVLLDNMATEIEKQLRNSQYASLAEVNDILAWNPELEKERHRTSVFRQELDFVEKQLHLLQSELKDQTFEEEAYQQLRLDIQSLQAEIGRKNEEKGSFQAILAKMKADLEKRIHFQVLLEKTEQRLVNIRVLKQLFKGSGFVRYISSVYLQELVQAANERFYKLSGQKLRLEITPGNDFEIRDFMNDGKTRNVKTLSGGQTFQAALSLALALSDNTRKLSGTGENFFFLDEGFGSLDKESLQVVFDTLKALRHENRIVGIISHVEDMNQEIDIHLRIRNEEEKGSVIERSWEREN